MNSIYNILDEETLLPELCRLEFSDEQIKKIRALIPKVTNWNYFSSLANAHGVAALVYHNLEKLRLLTFVPEENAVFLKGTLMKSLSRNAFNNETIIEVLKLLNRENIRTVLLKGMALELSDYGNEGLRQMSDIDILIGKAKCLNARRILLSNGFISLPVKSVFHKLIIANLGKHLPTLIKNGTSVEIHHELFGDSGSSLTMSLLDTSYEIDLEGEKVYIPQPQIFFLYLIRHLCYHEMNNESQLRLYTDLIVLLEKHRDKIIRPDLIEYASQADICVILANKLSILNEFWGIQFPIWLCDFIDNWYDPVALEKFLFFLKSPKGNPPNVKKGYYRLMLAEIPGFHRKFLFVLGDIFPSISFMKERYKCRSTLIVLLYYPHRLGKLLLMFRR
jgi:hypothetical protein